MKIFLGWSGSLSRQLADTFHTWIKHVIQAAEPFISLKGIDKGAAWHAEISETLKKCSFGIFFITEENRANPWMHFEAGALSKEIGEARVCPFLLGIHETRLSGPFSHFQAVRFDEGDVFRLVKNINDAVESPLTDEILKDSFQTFWPRLQQRLAAIESANLSPDDGIGAASEQADVADLKELVRTIVESHSIHQYGLRAIYTDRRQALREMHEQLDSEAKEIVIIGSSLLGLIGVGGQTAGDQNLIRIALFDALRRGVKVKILMTSPNIAHLRAKQEGRVAGDIEREILENLIYMLGERLEDEVVARNLEIKLYNGTPTIFMVSTSHGMFFNPYTYYARAFESLCYRAGKGSAIFKNYYDHHYLDAWNDQRHSTSLKRGRKASVEQLQGLIMGTNNSGEPIIPSGDVQAELLEKLESRSEQEPGPQQPARRRGRGSGSQRSGG